MPEQIAVQLTEAELTELAISAIEAFQYSDGPYLEREHCALAHKLGYNEGRLAQFWRNAAEQAQQDLATMRARMSGIGAGFDALRPQYEKAKRKLAEETDPPRSALPAVIPPQPLPATWEDLLAVMNNRHAIIDNVGGRTVIASWEPSSLDPTRLMIA